MSSLSTQASEDSTNSPVAATTPINLEETFKIECAISNGIEDGVSAEKSAVGQIATTKRDKAIENTEHAGKMVTLQADHERNIEVAEAEASFKKKVKEYISDDIMLAQVIAEQSAAAIRKADALIKNFKEYVAILEERARLSARQHRIEMSASVEELGRMSIEIIRLEVIIASYKRAGVSAGTLDESLVELEVDDMFQ